MSNVHFQTTWKNQHLPSIFDEGKEEERNKQRLASRAAYEENIKHPAGKTFLPTDFPDDQLTEVLPGRAWVLPNALTSAECADWIARAEAAGLEKPDEGKTLRSSSRTANYNDAKMSVEIQSKLTSDLISNIEKSHPGSAFRGVHDNWKIAKYEKGQSFPAHYDQESFTTLPANKEGIKVNY